MVDRHHGEGTPQSGREFVKVPAHLDTVLLKDGIDGIDDVASRGRGPSWQRAEDDLQ